jgi:Putative Actinobacterial Holin-X, holin superfamily III
LDAPAADPRDESIGDLVSRLIEDGRDYAEAELEVLRAIAAYRAIRARRALVALAAGWFLLVSSMTALVIGAVTGLAQHMSPFLAGLAVGVPLALGGYALVSYGWTGVKGLSRDNAEQDAIERGKAP